jgi:hypothetical protein
MGSYPLGSIGNQSSIMNIDAAHNNYQTEGVVTSDQLSSSGTKKKTTAATSNFKVNIQSIR